MKKILNVSFLLTFLLFLGSCQKQLILEEGNSPEVSEISSSLVDPSTPEGIQPLILGDTVGLKAAPAGQTWSLVFSDEFDDASLDLTKWTKHYPTHFPTGGRTHNHQAWMAPENVWLDAGDLVIKGSDQRHPDAPYSALQGGKTWVLDYQAGAVHTMGKFSLTYGYIEGHFKSTSNIGTWPAFWTLNSDMSWPPEIDILEIPIPDAAHRKEVHVGYHYGPDWQNHYSFGKDYVSSSDLSADYHTYGVEWGPDYMRFFFDGVQIFERTGVPVCSEGEDMYILINLAIGGWPGTPPAGQTWPDFYKCDWVRVYQLGTAGNTAPTITSSAAPTTATEGVAYSHTFSATDVDGDNVTLSAPIKPSWLSFNASTGVLSGTPAAGDIGGHSVVLRASDGTDNTDESFTITVSADTPSSMHVSAITFDKRKAGKKYYVFGQVTVKDDSGQVVSGATVDITWGGAVSGSDSATTDRNGLVSIKSDRVFDGGTFALTVNNVTLAGSTYDSAANVETTDSVVNP